MEMSNKKNQKVESGLNPYYNGRYSWRETVSDKKWEYRSLNPYYNGRYSWSGALSRGA